ncbi:unnamed protein product [Paramecium pentaurelia]|uniref:HSF-type DNA-binding domain-containing protein n=1 Tax=Paramecium pentaurelia TaxID=43138 RepID=A0A8S1Y3H7_9CILI|nr:unnamed protein product [Paramecium pentaurelia]
MGNQKKFLQKLFHILQSKQHEDCIQWSQDGNSLLIISAELFEVMVMPSYFNSTKISTFYRQLSQYGFKVKQNENRQKQFYHSNFQQGNIEKLLNIEKRKKLQRHLDYSNSLNEENKKLNNELKLLQKQQLVIQAQLNIHTKIYLQICKQITTISNYFFKCNKDSQECTIFFEAIISVFKGFNPEIASNIFEDLKNIGGPLSPQLSPLLFPYLKFV